MADDLHLGNDDDSILSAHSESSESSWSSFTSMSTQQSYDDSDVDVEDDDPAAVPIFGLSKEYFTNAVFLQNLRTCLYGNQISAYFNMEPMSMDEYLALID